MKVDSENNLPENVVKILQFCVKCKIGIILSRNVKVLSCQDARSNRQRLGHVGIPLYDEFKSIMLKGITHQGHEIALAAHCRGHMSIDMDLIAKRLRLDEVSIMPEDKPEYIVIMPEYEMNEKYHMAFGTVNPILIDIYSKGSILQIFDESLLKPLTNCPGTMMTNAGDYTWGMEFEASKLITSIENRLIAPIAYADKELKQYELPNCVNPKSIGIITGNGADSGMLLWRNINRKFVKYLDNHFLGDISLPHITVVSLPAMGLSMELEKRNKASFSAIKKALLQMAEHDVELFCLACNTTHYFTDQIREILSPMGKKFISMPEAVAQHLKDNNINDIALLGLHYVASLQEYSAYKELLSNNIESVPVEVLGKFHALAYEVKKIRNKQNVFQRFVKLLGELKSTNVILALTELSILYESNSKRYYGEKNIIDSLEVYSDAIVRESLMLK